MFDPDQFGPTDHLRALAVAVTLAVVTAFIRTMADESETRFIRIALEAIFCGLITVSVCSAQIAMELHWGWSIFSGGVIGSMGSTYVRVIARWYVAKRSHH